MDFSRLPLHARRLLCLDNGIIGGPTRFGQEDGWRSLRLVNCEPRLFDQAANGGEDISMTTQPESRVRFEKMLRTGVRQLADVEIDSQLLTLSMNKL